MLETMFEIIATMADDPDGYRSDMRTKLLEIADTAPLAPMAAARERKVRAFIKETVGNLLIKQPPNQSPPAQFSKTRSDGWAEHQRRTSAGRKTGRKGQPQERQHSADAERGGTRDRLQSRDRLRRHPYAGQ